MFQTFAFSSSGEKYALPLESIEEILPFIPIEAGAIFVRGRLIPVHDAAARLGGARTGAPGTLEDPHILVVRTSAGSIGLAA